MVEELTFSEKTHGRWGDIFSAFISDEKFNKALSNPGKHVPSPFNLASRKDGFRLDKEFETKNGLGYCNANGAMSGLTMIAFITGQDENHVAHQIHNFLDGKELDVFKVKAEIKEHQEQQQHKDVQKIEFNKSVINDILNLQPDNSYRDNYLKSRGLKQAIPLLNKDVFSVKSLYYDKNNKPPAMITIVRNDDNKIAFLHRTFLDEQGNKADVETVKKVTGKARESAYQRPYFAQVNTPKNSNSKHVHICEGIETALAVTLLTKNSDPVISAVNANGLVQFNPHKGVQKVFIWADNDKKGIEAADKLQEKLHGQVKTQLLKPKQQGQDFLNHFNNQKDQKQRNKAASKDKGGLSR